MSCNRLYGGQKKNKQASQRKRSGGEVKDDGDGSPVKEVVGGITAVVGEVVNTAADDASTEKKPVKTDSTTDASTEENPVKTDSTAAASTAASTAAAAASDAPAPPAQESNSFFGFEIGNLFGNKGGKRRTQRKQQKQRKTQKAGSKKTVIGRIYSKTCVHCVAMEKAWKQLKKMIKQGGGNIVMKDMEARQMGQQLQQMNNQFLGGSDQRVELQGGFPTLFKIKNNKVEYYGGERTADAMFNWALQ